MTSQDSNETIKAPTAPKRSKILVASWALFAITLFGLLSWVLVSNDPLGGEPVAIVKLDKLKDQTPKVDTQKLGMRKTVRPEDLAKVAKNTEPPPLPLTPNLWRT